jgi:hypothetical protein
MTTVVLIVGFVAVFGLGVGAGAAIVRARYRSRAYLEKAIENARLQGRLDRGDQPPRLDRPPPW